MEVQLIKHPTDEDWLLAKKCTLVTVGKETEVAPTEEFKKKLLRARHSPIRELKFVFLLTDVPYWVTVHLCRHVHAQPYVRSQRNDRTPDDAPDRNKQPQDTPVDMMWSMNAEELITICNKRLCNLASAETRSVVRNMVKLVLASNPEFRDELVPICIRNNYKCYEIYPCELGIKMNAKQ